MTRVFVLLILLCACSPEMSAASKRSGPPRAMPPVEGACMTGPQSCYCPDGTLSGTQSCDARQVRSSCVCAGSSAPSTTGTEGDPTRVCGELKGMASCDAKSYVSPQVPSSILFLLDRTGTMACNPPPTQTPADCEADPKRAYAALPSKWEITVKALNDALAQLSGSNATIGLSLFSTNDICGVDSTPSVGLSHISPAHLMAMSDVMAATIPAGGTPSVGAVVLAYHHLHQELHAPGNRYVVLLTDGEENCGTLGDDANTADIEGARTRLLDVEVKKARDANIKTFVIGSPGSEAARGFLSELAYLGGTARSPDCVHGDRNSQLGDCHFDLSKEADFAAVLRETLGKISGEALGCEFQTPPGAGALLNVQYSQNGATPICFAHDQAPCDAGANGWQYATLPDGGRDVSRVVLCGEACNAVKADPTTVVDVILGCAVIE